jgi:hypothetical protein
MTHALANTKHPQSIPPRDLYQFEKGPHPF